ncbi:MAG: hypothetical protein GY847_13495 [Proteobacteria bacterium]|nr:hypothetical protein [Pseudomonadota bacterium]
MSDEEQTNKDDDMESQETFDGELKTDSKKDLNLISDRDEDELSDTEDESEQLTESSDERQSVPPDIPLPLVSEPAENTSEIEDDLDKDEQSVVSEEDPLPLVSPPTENEDEPDENGTFASGEAPWVGAEEKWRAISTDKIQKPRDSEPFSDSFPPEEASELFLHDSYPTGTIGPDSLPALAAQPKRKISSEAKLVVTAVFLTIVILAAAVSWWMIDVTTEKTHAEQMAESQQAMIDQLKKQIEELTTSEKPENHKLADKLRVELETAQATAMPVAQAGTMPVAVQPEAQPQPSGNVPDTKPWKPYKNKDSKAEIDKAETGISSNEDSSNESPVESTGEKPTGESSDESADQESTIESPDESTPANEKDDELPSNPYPTGDMGASSSARQEVKPFMGDLGSNDEIEDLLDKAINERPSKTQPNPKDSSKSNPSAAQGLNGTSNTPSRAQVKLAMDAVAQSIKKCGNGAGGRIVFKIAVLGTTGRVMNAHPITQKHIGTPVGLCATRAVRLAKFPKFNQNMVVIKYPFDL